MIKACLILTRRTRLLVNRESRSETKYYAQFLPNPFLFWSLLSLLYIAFSFRSSVSRPATCPLPFPPTPKTPFRIAADINPIACPKYAPTTIVIGHFYIRLARFRYSMSGSRRGIPANLDPSPAGSGLHLTKHLPAFQRRPNKSTSEYQIQRNIVISVLSQCSHGIVILTQKEGR